MQENKVIHPKIFLRIQNIFVSTLALLECFVDSWTVGSSELAESGDVVGCHLACQAAELRSQHFEFC